MIRQFFFGIQIGLAIAIGLFFLISGTTTLIVFKHGYGQAMLVFLFCVLVSNVLATMATFLIKRYES